MTIESSLIELVNHECIINGNKSQPSLCLCKWALQSGTLHKSRASTCLGQYNNELLEIFYLVAARGRKFGSRRWAAVGGGGYCLAFCSDEETHKAHGGCYGCWMWSHTLGNKANYWSDQWQSGIIEQQTVVRLFKTCLFSLWFLNLLGPDTFTSLFHMLMFLKINVHSMRYYILSIYLYTYAFLQI